MATLNTFQEQLVDYFAGSTAGFVGATGSAIQSTVSNSYSVGYQGPQAPGSATGGLSCGWEVKADPAGGVVYMDTHTTPGFIVNDFDTRTIYGGGATGQNGQGGAVFQGSAYTFYCPIRTNPVGAALPPAFYIDYGSIPVNVNTNALTTITFNTTFVTAPKVIVQWVDDGTGVQSHSITSFVETTTTTTCDVRCLGTPGAGFSYNWMAIGGV